MIDKFDNIYINKLKKLYTFEKGVDKFLFDNTFLVDILFEARPILEQFFSGAEVKLYIEDNFLGRLIARVYSDYTMDEDERLIFAFDRHWWNEAADRAKDKLCITA
jgi:hypothetical protein